MKKLGADIGQLEDRLDKMGPIGRDIETVEGQIHEVQVINTHWVCINDVIQFGYRGFSLLMDILKYFFKYIKYH